VLLVSISSTFYASLFVRNCFAELFSNYSLALLFFWQKNIGAKAACKMLMISPTGQHSTSGDMDSRNTKMFLCSTINVIRVKIMLSKWLNIMLSSGVLQFSKKYLENALAYRVQLDG